MPRLRRQGKTVKMGLLSSHTPTLASIGHEQKPKTLVPKQWYTYPQEYMLGRSGVQEK